MRQAAGFSLLRQTVQAVVGVAGDVPGLIGFTLLTAAGVVGVGERGDNAACILVLNVGQPVCLVIAVGLRYAVGVGQAGAVAVRVVSIRCLLLAAFADRGQSVQRVVGCTVSRNCRCPRGAG